MNLKEAQKRILEIEKEIEHLEKEKTALQDNVKKYSIEENTRAYLNAVFSVNQENAMHVRLYADTKTTPIMDDFYSSEKQFLVFDRAFFRGRDLTRLSLVVSKMSARDVAVLNSGLTMTDLKKTVGIGISDYTINYYKETGRLYPLIKELIRVTSLISEDDGAIPFETPIRLGGQTYANQTGFGSEYNGDIQVYQGTLYGETTGFCIIGVLTSH